jgi:hypothetical protein
MRQLQVHKQRQAARARREADDLTFSLNLRDPDIARAKQLQAASQSRARAPRGGNTS